MSVALAKPVRAPKPGFASSVSNDPDLDRVCKDPQKATPASQVRQTSDPVGRSRPVEPTTCEREFAAAEQEFMEAMQEYKQWSGRKFPTWSEVLEVAVGLGYAKVAAPSR